MFQIKSSQTFLVNSFLGKEIFIKKFHESKYSKFTDWSTAS